jgi:hypothetical protein
MYQLPPVMSKMIFEDISSIESLGIHPWRDLFVCIELHEIMRHKDDLAFAELLNRVRTGMPIKEDIEILKSRVTKESDCLSDALHVFATNAECDRYNRKMLDGLKEDSVFYSEEARDTFANIDD